MYQHDPLVFSYLSNNFSEEFIGLVDRLFSAFELVDYQDFEDKYIETISMEGVWDKHGILDQFLEHIREDCEYVLQKHGVKTYKDVSISDLIRFTDAVVSLNFLEDYGILEDIFTDLEMSDEEKFSECVYRVGELPRERILPLISELEEGLIDKLEDYVVEVQLLKEGLSEANKLNDEEKQTLRKIAKVLGEESLLVDLLKRGVPIKGALFIYLAYLDLDSKSLQDDIISILAITDPSMSKWIEYLRNQILPLIDDPLKTSSIDAYVISIMNRVEQMTIEVEDEQT